MQALEQSEHALVVDKRVRLLQAPFQEFLQSFTMRVLLISVISLCLVALDLSTGLVEGVVEQEDAEEVARELGQGCILVDSYREELVEELVVSLLQLGVGNGELKCRLF